MTLQELYQHIGADYERALRVLRMDKLLDKHIRKLLQNGVIARSFLRPPTPPRACAPIWV